jgi:DNA-binding FadR family transcriptional regulator
VEHTIEADLRFHLAVAKAAHNPFFEMVIDPLTQVYIQQIKLTDSYTLGLEQHRQVFEQIAKGDPVGARQAVRRMMRSTREHTKRVLTVLAGEAR